VIDDWGGRDYYGSWSSIMMMRHAHLRRLVSSLAAAAMCCAGVLAPAPAVASSDIPEQCEEFASETVTKPASEDCRRALAEKTSTPVRLTSVKESREVASEEYVCQKEGRKRVCTSWSCPDGRGGRRLSSTKGKGCTCAANATRTVCLDERRVREYSYTYQVRAESKFKNPFPFPVEVVVSFDNAAGSPIQRVESGASIPVVYDGPLYYEAAQSRATLLEDAGWVHINYLSNVGEEAEAARAQAEQEEAEAKMAAAYAKKQEAEDQRRRDTEDAERRHRQDIEQRNAEAQRMEAERELRQVEIADEQGKRGRRLIWGGVGVFLVGGGIGGGLLGAGVVRRRDALGLFETDPVNREEHRANIESAEGMLWTGAGMIGLSVLGAGILWAVGAKQIRASKLTPTAIVPTLNSDLARLDLRWSF
jgi:hypothetical protein